jgi:hypothetical protein
MRHFGRGVAALVAMVSMGVVAAASPAAARTRTAAQGVSDKEILLVAVVADLDSLRSKGLIAQPKLTTGNLLKRFQLYADAYGPIHGRKIVVKGVTVDPLDPTSFDKVCTAATQDNKPFVVVNGAGFRTSAVPCVTVDNNTPLFSGDPMTTALFKASGNNLFALPPSGDVMGSTTADVVAKQKLVPKTAKIGILSSNDLGIKAAGDALEAGLKKNGYTVAQKIELNGLSGDASALNRESATAVGTFKAAGVDTVFVGLQFSATQGFFQENQRSQAGLKTFIIDDAASMCTPFSASRIPLEAAGTPCVSTWDTKALPTKDGVKPDSKAEADCRASFDEAFDASSQPGVPAGDLSAGGVAYSEDFASTECNMMSLLLPAMEKAGKNLTWPKVAANLAQTSSAPAIYMSGGVGGFAKNKHYFATKVHLVVLNPANPQTAKDAAGLFNGCPAPVNCWVPQPVDGAEWFPVR